MLGSLGGLREAAYVNALMADVLIWAGRWSDAFRLLDETLRRSAHTGVMAFDARLRTSKAAALALDGEIASAEQEFERAIGIARGQLAKMFELQACSGLARLWLSQGRPKEARLLIEPIVAWFTEGLNLPDLQEARAIVAACGP